MSSQARREQLRAEEVARDTAREEEEHRKSLLTMWERIEEVDASDSVKELLHLIAEKLGLET